MRVQVWGMRREMVTLRGRGPRGRRRGCGQPGGLRRVAGMQGLGDAVRPLASLGACTRLNI